MFVLNVLQRRLDSIKWYLSQTIADLKLKAEWKKMRYCEAFHWQSAGGIPKSSTWVINYVLENEKFNQNARKGSNSLIRFHLMSQFKLCCVVLFLAMVLATMAAVVPMWTSLNPNAGFASAAIKQSTVHKLTSTILTESGKLFPSPPADCVKSHVHYCDPSYYYCDLLLNVVVESLI